MSEHVQYRGAGEFTFDNVLASLDDQYVECDPQPKLLNPIFEKLHEDQIKFATERRYKSMEQAVMVGEGYIALMNERLEKAGRKRNRGLMGEVVTLTGEDIISTSTTANFFTAESALVPVVAGDEAGEFNAQTKGVRGYFRGVSFLVGNADPSGTNRDDDTNEEATHYVRLHYLVQYGTANSPFGLLPVAAIGEIGVSKLTFLEDEQRIAIHDALSQLLSNDSLEVAGLVNDLNRALSGMRMTGEDIRQVSELTTKLHACSELSTEDSEAILELITAYIPAGTYDYKIDASYAVQYPAQARGNEQYFVEPEEGKLLEYDQEPSAIILAPGFAVRGEPHTNMELERTGIVPYFVFEQNDNVIHVSMDHVQSFGPGGY
jgi:hypothetical protein